MMLFIMYQIFRSDFHHFILVFTVLYHIFTFFNDEIFHVPYHNFLSPDLKNVVKKHKVQLKPTSVQFASLLYSINLI